VARFLILLSIRPVHIITPFPILLLLCNVVCNPTCEFGSEIGRENKISEAAFLSWRERAMRARWRRSEGESEGDSDGSRWRVRARAMVRGGRGADDDGDE